MSWLPHSVMQVGHCTRVLGQEGRREAALARALDATAPVQEGRGVFSELHYSTLGLAEALQ